jgi:hypothetical protein
MQVGTSIQHQNTVDIVTFHGVCQPYSLNELHNLLKTKLSKKNKVARVVLAWGFVVGNPKAPIELECTRNLDIVHVSTSVSITLFLTASGRVFMHNHKDGVQKLLNRLRPLKIVIETGLPEQVPPIKELDVNHNSHAIMRTYDDKIFILRLTKGESSQLKAFTPRYVPVSPVLAGICTGGIYGNYGTFYYYTKAGDLYSWGDNDQGELGRRDPTSLEPKIIKELSGKVKSVSAASYHVLVITFDNELYSFGYNSYWGLGRDTKHKQNMIPGKVMINFIPQQAACFHFGSACLSIDGNVYLWGQTHQESLKAHKIYKEEGVEDVVQIACGHQAITYLTRSGRLYFANSHSLSVLCSIPIDNEPKPDPAFFKYESRIFNIFMGARHAFALLH